VDCVDAIVKRLMMTREFGGRITLMDRLLHQRTYRMRIRYTTKTEGKVLWNGNQVLVDDKKFDMDGIPTTVVHGSVETVRDRLYTKLMFADGNAIPTVDVGSLADNPAETSGGWSFLDNTRNVFPVDGRRWMWRRLASEGDSIGARFIEGGIANIGGWGDIWWRQGAIKAYFQQLRRFKELMVLVHLSVRPTARATKLLSIPHTNGAEAQNQKGVFTENGTVSSVTAYLKGFNASQKAKFTHWYVPKEVGGLVVQFFWLIQPFIEQLQATVREDVEVGGEERSDQFQE
jgi:hypothetical protein